jgi:hypothetical protein
MADYSRCREVWVEAADSSALLALINGDLGWLLYMREPGDPGFSSRNLGYSGLEEAMIKYRLNNGQVDEYPASWAYPTAMIERALFFFRSNGKPPAFISWHNDSSDGTSCGVDA